MHCRVVEEQVEHTMQKTVLYFINDFLLLIGTLRFNLKNRQVISLYLGVLAMPFRFYGMNHLAVLFESYQKYDCLFPWLPVTEMFEGKFSTLLGLLE